MLRLRKDDVLLARRHDQDRVEIAEEPRARRASQLVFIAAALIYPTWHWIFLSILPTARDPLGERLTLSAIMLAALGAHRFKLFRRHIAVVEG